MKKDRSYMSVKKVCFSFLWVFTIFLLTIKPSFSYTVTDSWIKPGIPDVNKFEFGENTTDNSCRVAATTNLLWAAGYRYAPEISPSGDWSWYEVTDPWDLYDQILDTVVFTGYGDPFVKGWKYSQEKDWMEWYFDNNTNEKDNKYKKVTYEENRNGLTINDRTYVMNELKRCQYVELGIGDLVEDEDPNWYHSVTLVGWYEYTESGDPNTYTGTIIHDSDQNQNGSSWEEESNDSYRDYVVDSSWFLGDAEVYGYKTLCPVPEPTTLLLLGSGLMGLAVFRRKFRKS